MHNDPELSGKYLGTISEDFVKVSDTLKEASYQIRKAGFDHPIFPLCKTNNQSARYYCSQRSMERHGITMHPF